MSAHTLLPAKVNMAAAPFHFVHFAANLFSFRRRLVFIIPQIIFLSKYGKFKISKCTVVDTVDDLSYEYYLDTVLSIDIDR